MLPPEYFDHKEDRLLELYRQLENFILKDITRRLLSAGEMTATADRLIWKLKQMGESQTKIEIKLRQMTGFQSSLINPRPNIPLVENPLGGCNAATRLLQ